ncbi:putative pyridoxal kinase [Saccharomycopsis crataegensis]|uniref:pyridoxal kinase n=1 Tax=Saccharomycopsis crataegensis TaxID=43959 RepID=A0AAV5QEZ7_9ASCO|nr:putative pyridoxal kinase [Saccharomycopsis crataegensis]
MKKLLSIQSHVVHGYVGNKAATFPLQLKGWDVDALNTVQYSNHPAYGSFYGIKYQANELLEIYKKIVEVAQVHYSVVLSGYITSKQHLESIIEIVNDAKTHNPNVKWFFDPIIGDNGRIYINDSNSIIELYKMLLRQGQPFLVTPNHFELELLTDTKITNLESLKQALTKFKQLYPLINSIVVTSVDLAEDPGYLICAGSTNDSDTFIYYKIPKFNGFFFGSGDLFGALLADSYINHEASSGSRIDILANSLNEVLSVLYHVLDYSYRWQLNTLAKSGQRIAPETKIKVNDLKIVQCKKYFTEDVELRYSKMTY